MKDYYDTLEIKKGASKDEIKKAFRKLAAQYHPDKKTGDEAKFKEISEAYGVLSDDKKRAQYDQFGKSGMGGGNPGAGYGGFGGFGGQGVEFDLNDIFSGFGDIFGGGGRQREVRGNDIQVDIELPFRDAIFGTERAVTLTKQNTCTTCDGTGAKKGAGFIECTGCNGQGKIREVRQTVMGAFQSVRDCTECHSRGKKPKEVCGDCRGAGVRRSDEKIDIKVPAGVQSGESIRMTGRGEAVQGGSSGDLYIRFHVAPHKTITRDGANLNTTLEVKLTDAVLGGEYAVETLDGELHIKIPEGVQHGEQLRIKGKGVPQGKSNARGDFMVRIKVPLPKKLSKKAKALLKDLREEGI